MNEKIFCIECKKYFKNKQDWDDEHGTLYYELKNIKHNFLIEGDTLSYIFDLMCQNSENKQRIIQQNLKSEKIANKLNFYEDSLKNDVHFETNICIKNISNQIFGKCELHFLPKCINFKIECNGEINFNARKEFEIEILFPFKEAKSKFCLIEKLKGCLSSKIIENSEEEIKIFSSYSSIVYQQNRIISIKLLRNYSMVENLKKNNIDVSLNGILTFSNYGINFKGPLVLYNIYQKKFLAYENYQWKFIESCFLEDGKIKKACIIYIELNSESGEIFIKNEFIYLGNNDKFITRDKDSAKFQFRYLNTFYGVITVIYNNKYLNSNDTTGLIEFSGKENWFMMINI
jgi:hypothetical protein